MAIDDSVWQKLRRRIEGLDAHARVGVLAGAGGGGFDMVALAATHEFGSPTRGIPERSFIRRTFQLKEKELATLTRKLAKAVLLGKMTEQKALDILGTWGASEIKKTIADNKVTPPTSDATNERKGSDTTLEDTGRLMNSITHVVVGRGTANTGDVDR